MLLLLVAGPVRRPVEEGVDTRHGFHQPVLLFALAVELLANGLLFGTHVLNQSLDTFRKAGHRGRGALAAAAAAGNVIGFGQASDMAEYADGPRVSSIIDDWAPYYIERTRAVMDGTWESVSTWDGIGAGMVGIGEITDRVPAEVKAQALELKEKIASGAYHPFTGPLNKQDGTPWLAEGEIADDATLAGMNFFVEGIEGDIPN